MLAGDLKLRKKTRTRLPQVRWTKHGYLCLHLLDIALYYHIETNPGPKAKPKCGSCEKTIRKNQEAILCERCEDWFHFKCSGLSRDLFHDLGKSTEEWMCLTCGLPRFTDSFFESPNCSILDIVPKADNDEVKSDIVNGLSQYANTQIVIGNLNINSLPGKFAEMQE